MGDWRNSYWFWTVNALFAKWYWCDDQELKGNVKYFIEKNKFFNQMFKKYGIKTFDTSFDRENMLNFIIENLENLENAKKN